MGRKNANDRRERREARKEKERRKATKEAMKAKKKGSKSGEEDLDTLIHQFTEMDAAREKVQETKCSSISPRSAASLVFSTLTDELILFGGEYTNGLKTFIYGDLFFYNTRKSEWRQLKIPNCPPPRSGHQAVFVSRLGGQMWIFGGEYASPNGDAFKHFNDLWVLHLKEQRWEKIDCAGGPSSRSGHRMVAHQRCLVVFGGFHDNAKKSPKYFGDVHVFDLEKYRWYKLEFPVIQPSPDARSACQMADSPDGIYVFAGYSKVRARGEMYKGMTHTDMWRLQAEPNDDAKQLDQDLDEGKSTKRIGTKGSLAAGLNWQWTRMRPGGQAPSMRCGAACTVRANGSIISFGGVCDQETDEALKGDFFNELFQLNTSNLTWSQLRIKDMKNAPCPRMGAHLCCKGNNLFLYGGVFEVGNKQITLGDLYSIDLSKLNEWKVLVPTDPTTQQWLEEESSEEDSDRGDDDAEDDANEL